MTAYLYGVVPEEQGRLLDQTGIIGTLNYPSKDQSGYKVIELHHRDFHFDQRKPEHLKNIAQYWKGLMTNVGCGMIYTVLMM
ncbi:hypothetical protein LZF95_12040 [Algoriphagus sp. AGSA1]|uniref:hypothetical protein n=1 Tax=Algoriphagus sp. AGSA1 TaxID=2907213 RepID=UPI001F408145|nr:hypothetical protein [Algoriphagus sp. AGSA1]MCE7055408.1 hypothetical protein [Algoriphagus sp. AGSA1]